MYSLTGLRHLSFLSWCVSAHIKLCHLPSWRKYTLHTRPLWDAEQLSCAMLSFPSSPAQEVCLQLLHTPWQSSGAHCTAPTATAIQNRSGEGGKYLHSKAVMQNLFSNITSSSSSLFSQAIFWKRCRRELSADTLYGLHIEPQAKRLQILVPQSLIWSMDKCLNSEETKF